MANPPLSFTTDPIPQLTWKIAVPICVGMFFNTMYNFVDTYCAGLLSTDALAALSLSFPLFFLVIAIGSGLSQGSTALIANALGSGDQKRAHHLLRFSGDIKPSSEFNPHLGENQRIYEEEITF